MDTTLTQEKLGQRIRVLREADSRGLSQSDLAELIGLNQTGISKIENGDRVVSAIELVRLASALGVTVTELVEEEETVFALRATEADSEDEAISESIRVFRQCIDSYFGLKALVPYVG